MSCTWQHCICLSTCGSCGHHVNWCVFAGTSLLEEKHLSARLRSSGEDCCASLLVAEPPAAVAPAHGSSPFLGGNRVHVAVKVALIQGWVPRCDG